MEGRWRRITLLDCAVIVAALAGGLGLFTNDRFGTVNDALNPLPRIVVGLLAGFLVAGPLVILSQLFRGRYAALGLGEWLWLCSGGLALLIPGGLVLLA